MKKITLIIAAISAIGLSGCKKYLDQSVNPNSPSVTTLPFSLTGTESIMAAIPNGLAQITPTNSYVQYGYWMGVWAVSSGFIVQPNLSQYVTNTNDFQVWTDLYLNLSNINSMQQLAVAQKSPNYQAIAMIMKAYDFQQLVDNYNDVPYSQAFNTSNLFPAYDKGPAIYADLLKQLDAAIALINSSSSAAVPAGDDVIFGGNMTGWKKFANSLKLRIIMRQSNLAGFSALTAEMATTLSEGFLDGTLEADAQPGYTLNDAHGGQESPFWLAYGTNQNGNAENILVKANTFAINMLHGFNDPRLTALYTTVQEPEGTANAGANVVRGLYLGDPQLSQDTNAAGSLSAIGPGLLKSASMPAVVFSGYESLFLQAEAAVDGIIPGGTGAAKGYYEAAITASFVATGAEYQVPGSSPAAYYTPLESAPMYYNQNKANVGWNASSANLEQAIITQKYIALNGYSLFEIYNDWRRTGYPLNVPRSLDEAAIGTNIPVRLYYPQIEFNTNGKNVGAEGTIDPFSSRVFWDTNTGSDASAH
jgi:hypothetical protein